MLYVYEDEHWTDLLPLIYFRPVFDLHCGRRTLLEKTQALYPRERIILLVRPELVDLTRELHPGNPVPLFRAPRPVPASQGNALFLSGRAILEKPLPLSGPEEVFVNGPEVVAFRVNPKRLRGLPVSQKTVRTWGLPQRKVLASIVRYPWNLVEFNEPELRREFPRRKTAARLPESACHLLGNRREVYVAKDASIEPGTVIDARSGPVYLDQRAKVRARSVISGPCYIGPGTVIDAALIRPGCAFGPDCRIGGEVEASIFLGHSNKHHEGFIGHSVVSEWVNLGALTTNSDLRNDYGEVQVIVNGRTRNSLLRKFGCIIGDHARTAIGTLLNTGTSAGIFANWFEPGLSPKLIPDFAHGARQRGRLGVLTATARTVMARRGRELTPAYERLIRRYYGKA